MKQHIYTIPVIILAAIILVLFLSPGGCSNYQSTTQTDTIRVSDTLVIRDTIRIKEPKPYYVEVVRTDTFVFRDTVKVPLPIEQKTYKTDYYRAVIEGYNPALLSMEVYNKTVTIRDTLKINNTITKYKSPRWVVSVGPGIGYSPKGVEPYIGVSVGFVLWSK